MRIIMKYWHVTSYHLVLRKRIESPTLRFFYDNDREKTLQIIICIVTLKDIYKNLLRKMDTEYCTN